MPRPRADQAGLSAQERLEVAFWRLLAERPYADLTIGTLCRRAGVNHNAFYYYFANIDDMARVLFERNTMPELPRTLLPLLAAGLTDLDDWAGDDEVRAHLDRAILFARRSSPALRAVLKDSIIGVWMDAAGVDPARLTSVQRDQLEFVFGGLMSVLGTAGDEVHRTMPS